jgi:hypothetical protein
MAMAPKGKGQKLKTRKTGKSLGAKGKRPNALNAKNGKIFWRQREKAKK